MDKTKLEKLASAGMTIAEIADACAVSYTTIRYWLHKLGVQTVWMARKVSAPTDCSVCGSVKKNKKGRRCASCDTKVRRTRCKIAAVVLLGGECAICGRKANNHNLPVFDFHHLDANQKEFDMSAVARLQWERVRAELEKCILVCTCCHRLLHSNVEEYIEEVLDYEGRQQELVTLLKRWEG